MLDRVAVGALGSAALAPMAELVFAAPDVGCSPTQRARTRPPTRRLRRCADQSRVSGFVALVPGQASGA